MQRKWMLWLLSLVLAAALAPGLVAKDKDLSEPDNANVRFSGQTIFTFDDSAFLGVTMEEETEHPEGGARITRVVDESPAAQAGLEVGDIVIAFSGDTIRGPVGLTKKIRGQEPGDTVEITVLRDGRREKIVVELADRSVRWRGVAPHVFEGLENLQIPEGAFDLEELQERLADLNLGEMNFDSEALQGYLSQLGEIDFKFDECEDDNCGFNYRVFSGHSKPRLGVQLTETTPELREHLGGSAEAGVLVSKVIDDSAAQRAGMHVGDLIVDLDGEAIADTQDLRSALDERQGETFEITVIREGRSVQLSVTIEEADEDSPSGPRAMQRFQRPQPMAAPQIRFRPRPIPQLPLRVAVIPPTAPVPPRPAFPVRVFAADDVI